MLFEGAPFTFRDMNTHAPSSPLSADLPPVGPDSRFVLLDGSGFIFRAYHALPPLTRRSDGAPVGAVSGFCNMLFKLIQDSTKDRQATHFAVMFDTNNEDNFRKKIYSAYKANRPPPPEDLIPQFSMVRDAVRAFGVPSIEVKGFEADDLLASYASEAEALGAEVIIVSSDKDLMQLVSSKVTMYDAMKDRSLGVQDVEEKFGVGPDRVADVQALSGDSVDNIPGIPGIGPKTASLLIQTFGDLETLLERAGEIPQNKRRENLLNHADDARMSRDLVVLRRDAPRPYSLESLALKSPDPDTLFDFFEKMGFQTLRRRAESALGKGTDSSTSPHNAFDRSRYACVQTEEALTTWMTRAYEVGYVAVDTETDALSSTHAGLVGVSLAVEDGEACYIPLGHGGADLLSGLEAPPQIPMARALELLKPLLEDPAVLKIGQNIKYDLGVFRRYGIDVTPYDDTMLLSYVLEGGALGHSMNVLSERHLDYKPLSFQDVAGRGKEQKSFDKISLEPATEYAAEDADITLRLWKHLKPALAQQKSHTIYEILERSLPRVLADMELAGIRVDPQKLQALSQNFGQRMAKLEARVHELAGRSFNLASPKQLSALLFDEMGLTSSRKTKSGERSTNAEALEALAEDGHELPRLLLDWRQFAKLKTTYTDALVDVMDSKTHRVHTSFALAATSTGRLASSDPNLQNIPIRTEEGRKIREAFIADPGHVLVSADYSQIELRLLAHAADTPTLKAAFERGEDIHATTASEVFDVPLQEVDSALRRRAKAINFGLIYGISAFGLARNIHVSRSEAAAYMKAYFEKFPGIHTYMEQTKEFARDHGFVKTFFGRRCVIPFIRDKNPHAPWWCGTSGH